MKGFELFNEKPLKDFLSTLFLKEKISPPLRRTYKIKFFFQKDVERTHTLKNFRERLIALSLEIFFN